MSTRLPDIAVPGACLSDLFFNFEHPSRDALYARRDWEFSDAEMDGAMLADARSFIDCLPVSEADKPALARLLVDNFNARV